MEASPKIPVRWADGGVRPVRCESGGWFEGDSVSECLELADVVAFSVFGAGAGVVEVCAEVVELGLVAEEVPDDHQDGSTDRDDGFLLIRKWT
jgi:hypothetical protein